MGASEWRYFVPYQPDIQKAFEELQAEVFKSWNYYDDEDLPFEVIQQGFEIMYSDSELSESKRIEAREALFASYRTSSSSIRATTIQELLEFYAENGTHSILDMQGISETKGWWVLAPLSYAQLIEYFGTEKPTRFMIEESLKKEMSLGYPQKILAFSEMGLSRYLQKVADRWRGEGTYIILYEENEPYEILFIGYSGD